MDSKSMPIKMDELIERLSKEEKLEHIQANSGNRKSRRKAASNKKTVKA